MRDRRAHPPRRPARSPSCWPSSFPVFRDAEEVIADPVVRNRGTIGGSLCQADAAEDLSRGLLGAQGHGRDPRRRGRAHGAAWSDFHVGPYMTAVRRRRAPHRDPAAAAGRAPAARTRRSSGARATGRSPPPRPPCGWTAARSPTPASRSARSGSTTIHLTPRRGAAARPGAVGRPVRAGGRDRVRGLRADRRTAAGRSTTSATSRASSPSARCAGPPHARSTRRPEHGGLDHHQRRAASRATSSRACCSCTSSATRSSLTGTHWGCDTSNCGACVVLMDGQPREVVHDRSPRCATGHEIRTVESLEVDGELDPVQQGFHELHALQCGFCTPGMLMTSRALLDENPDPTEQEIRTAISRRDLPLHGLQEHRRRGPLGGRARGRRQEVVSMAADRDRPPDRLRPPQAQGGRALHPRQGHLPRRHPPARHGPRRAPAQPVRAREDQLDRHDRGARAPERRRGRSPPRTSRRSASPGCRRSPTTRRPCWRATRSASRARRSRS